MSGENWHEERERLVQLLHAIESGTITHVDRNNLNPLEAVGSANVDALRERLAQLNARLA